MDWTNLLGIIRSHLLTLLGALGGFLDGVFKLALGDAQGEGFDQTSLPLVRGLGHGGQVAIDPFDVSGNCLRIAAEDGRSG